MDGGHRPRAMGHDQCGDRLRLAAVVRVKMPRPRPQHSRLGPRTGTARSHRDGHRGNAHPRGIANVKRRHGRDGMGDMARTARLALGLPTDTSADRSHFLSTIPLQRPFHGFKARTGAVAHINLALAWRARDGHLRGGFQAPAATCVMEMEILRRSTE